MDEKSDKNKDILNLAQLVESAASSLLINPIAIKIERKPFLMSQCHPDYFVTLHIQSSDQFPDNLGPVDF